MALEKKQVGFPFLKGINTKQSPKAQATGELTDCVNFRMDRAGRLDRREGFQQYGREIYGSSATVGTAKALTHLKDEVILLDGETAYSKTTDGAWVDRGGLLDVRSDCSLVHSDMQSTSSNASYAVSGDFEYLAWADQPFTSEGIGTDTGTGGFAHYKYMIRDRHTGATVVEPTAFPSNPFMDTRFTFPVNVTVDASSPNEVDTTSTWFTNDVVVGNYVQIGTKKRKVLAVVAGKLTVTPAFDGAISASPMTIWKDTGADALYFAPRIRLLAPTGGTSKWVIALFQQGRDIHYMVSKAGALGTDLPFVSKGELTMTGTSRRYPAWDADWLLSDNAAADDDGVVVAVGYTSMAGSADTYRLAMFSINSSGSLTSQEDDVISATSGTPTVTPAPSDFPAANYDNPTWQPFVKTIHDEDSNGVPQVTDGSRVLTGYTGTSSDSSVGLHTHVWLFGETISSSDLLTPVWDTLLFSASGIGEGVDWCLTRAGVGYDATYIYVMAEVQDTGGGGSVVGHINGESVINYFPQRSEVVTARFKRSDGTRSEEKSLWKNVSVHSDGFFPYGSTKGRCYWWVSGSQLTDPLNSVTFLADQDGKIHAHGVKGRAAINTSLEAQAHGTVVDNSKRNLQCGARRVTPGRWVTSGSTEFWCGSSVVGIGSSFKYFQHYRPGLLAWDTSPTRPFRNQEAHGVLYIGGGLLWAYDGVKFCETEFLLSPAVTRAAKQGLTDGNLPSGKYSYYAVFEYTDDGGARHVSSPAGPYAVTIPEPEAVEEGETPNPPIPDNIQLDIWFSQMTNCRFSGKVGDPATYSVKIYRTNTDGVVHYLHAVLDAGAWGEFFSPAALFHTYTDSNGVQHDAMSETLIWDTIGAESSGTPISSPIDVTRHKDSLIVSNTENVVYSSTGLIPGIAAIMPGLVAENAGAFGLYGDSQNEAITHIASNGLVCLFFTKSDGYAFEGEGPDSRAQGAWSAPVKFAPGQGVRPDGFIAATPMGVLYSSQSGIYLVGNDMKTVNIGAPVADYTSFAAANDPVVLDAASEVVIPIKGDSSINGSALVYNYFFKQWYRYELHSTVIGSNENIEWAAWVDENAKPVVYLVDSQGALYRQKGGTDSQPYADSTSGGSNPDYSVTASGTTSWIQFPGYGGRMRCYHVLLMGSSLPGETGDTTLYFNTYNNFRASSTTETWTVSVTTDGAGKDRLSGGSEVLFKPQYQKLDSMRVAFTVIGQIDERGWSPEGLVFEMGQRPIETRFKTDDDKSA